MCDQPSDPEPQIKIKSQIINVQIKIKTLMFIFPMEAAVICMREEQFLIKNRNQDDYTLLDLGLSEKSMMNQRRAIRAKAPINASCVPEL